MVPSWNGVSAKHLPKDVNSLQRKLSRVQDLGVGSSVSQSVVIFSMARNC